ncbi:MAG: hypothetical protein IKM98_00375, partial [Bacteroidales bacterium]|nr:hypothetical protein [Bacteroidales bacterium]
PVSGPSALVNALKATFSERYKIPVAQITDGKTFANKLANKNVADLKKKFVEDFDEDEMIPELYINSYQRSIHITSMHKAALYNRKRTRTQPGQHHKARPCCIMSFSGMLTSGIPAAKGAIS